MSILMSVLIGIGVYFGVGVVVLGIFDLFTKRVRTRLQPATTETRDKLLASGTFVGDKESLFLLLSAMWLFWPLVIFSAISSPYR